MQIIFGLSFLLIFEKNYAVVLLVFLFYFSSFRNHTRREGFSLFFTLLAWAEREGSKNKTYVPPGLWEQRPPSVLFWDMGEDREDLALRAILREKLWLSGKETFSSVY